MRRRYLGVIGIFIVASLATFLIWPIEKADYTHCGQNQFCLPEFSSVPAGGAQFLAHVGSAHDTQPAKTTLKQYISSDQKVVHNFAPFTVLAISLVVGLGVALIAALLLFKVRIQTSKR